MAAAGTRASAIIAFRVYAGVATLLVSIILFGTLSISFFPPQNNDSRGSTSRFHPERPSSRPKGRPTALPRWSLKTRASRVCSNVSMSATGA